MCHVARRCDSKPRSGFTACFRPRGVSPNPRRRGKRLPDAVARGSEAKAQYWGNCGLNQSAHYQVYLGDAWTDPLFLSVTPLPVVEMEAEVVLPVYARQSANELQKFPRGMRQFAVLAGSEVYLKLDTDRPLKAVDVKIVEQQCSSGKGGRNEARRADLPHETHGNRGRRGRSLDAAHHRHAAGLRGRANCRLRFRSTMSRIRPWSSRWKVSLPSNPTCRRASSRGPRLRSSFPKGSPTIHYEVADDHALVPIRPTWEATSSQAGVRPSDHTAGDTSAAEKREGRIEVCRFPPEACAAEPRGRLSAAPAVASLEAG